MKVLKEDVHPSEISRNDLTTDCLFIERGCGQTDLVKSSSMVAAFDYYYDLGIEVKRIFISKGNLNPKTQEPRI